MMCPSLQPSRPIILCPLEYELLALQAAGLSDHADLICTGPGRDNIEEWAEHHTPGDTIILAGLAGSLTPELPVGGAHIVSSVIDEQGEDRWTPAIQPTESNDQSINGVTSTSTYAPLTGRLARQLLNRETGSEIIDLESTAFATAALKYQWKHWGIVRGISDDLSTELPENIDQWVDEEGATRWKSVMRSLLLKPTLIPKIVELRNNSNAAMNAVAETLKAILQLDS